MTEPDVALTDYALALEAILFLALLRRKTCRRPDMRSYMMLFFASVSAASFCGGTYHGFFLDEPSPGSKIIWRATLISMGLTALSTWLVGAGLLVPAKGTQLVFSTVFVKQAARWRGAVGSDCGIHLFVGRRLSVRM